jgi:two-component system LytT family response regulator
VNLPSMLRAVIVDDEPLARQGLTADIANTVSPAVTVVAQCANAIGALQVIRCERPDIVFLDIEMPELNGFEMLARLEPEEMPAAVIVVSAFDHHALRGFEANALDFLLKPYTMPRLQRALERAAVRVHESLALRDALEREARDARMEDGGLLPGHESGRVQDAGGNALTGSHTTRLIVSDRDRTTVIDVDDIEWIGAESYYARLHVPPKSWLLRERMGVLATSLDPTQFFRTHRSAIVRISAIREILALSRYEHEIVLASGARIPLARSRKAALDLLISGM